MKTSKELKIAKTAKVKRMQEIWDGAKALQRDALNTAEQTEWDTLDGEVRALTTQITQAETAEENARYLADNPEDNTNTRGGKFPQVMKRASKVYNFSKAISEYTRGQNVSAVTGLEAETQQEISRGIPDASGLLLPYNDLEAYSARANANTTTHADLVDVTIHPSISIRGKEPLYQLMGCSVLPGLQGTFKMNVMVPNVAGKVAEEAAITTLPTVPTNVLMAPERYGITQKWSKELLATENPAVHAKILADMMKSIDRKITVDVHAAQLAAATEIAAGALTLDGFNALMAAVDDDGQFVMTRSTFFEAVGVAIDVGSGQFLAKLAGGAANGVGNTNAGVPAFYSNLFADGANQKYVIYGTQEETYVGVWGAIEFLLDPYTLQEEGQVRTTINKLAKIAVRNSGVYAKSPDLNPVE